MAKAQATARIMTEVAPPQVVSVMRRRKHVARSLDTIAEDDDCRELIYGGDKKQINAATSKATASTFATAPFAVDRQPVPAARGYMKELSKWFSNNNGVHGHEGWPEDHRRAVYGITTGLSSRAG
uniref:Uncharacterized protein n=1 Tax=Leersia perrieri TaxID=77586 RepID=A0A0D9VCI6_9ORYZ